MCFTGVEHVDVLLMYPLYMAQRKSVTCVEAGVGSGSVSPVQSSARGAESASAALTSLHCFISSQCSWRASLH